MRICGKEHVSYTSLSLISTMLILTAVYDVVLVLGHMQTEHGRTADYTYTSALKYQSSFSQVKNGSNIFGSNFH